MSRKKHPDDFRPKCPNGHILSKIDGMCRGKEGMGILFSRNCRYSKAYSEGHKR